MLHHWGLVMGKAKDGSQKSELNPVSILEPTLIVESKGLSFKKVDLGAHFALALRDDGKVFSWGSGKRGRLGHGSEHDFVAPQEIIGLQSTNHHIIDVSCGSWHALALDSSGKIFTWGSNSRGECGMSSSAASILKPTLLDTIGSPVVSVSAGHQVSGAITQDGRVFTWGSGTKGKLGRRIDKGFDHVPRELQLQLHEEELPILLEFGVTFGAVVTNQGRLFMFGANNCGQMGRPPSALSETFNPILVDFSTSQIEDDRFIEAVSCSKGEFHNHTLALARSGKIWGFGDNYKSKLGTGSPNDSHLPELLPALAPGDPVVQVAAGGIHSAALTRSGAVFTWGCGSDGRLGHPECKGHRYLYKEDTPRRVDGIKQVKYLACCYYSCLAIK